LTTQKFFRYLWRIDGILILVATGAIVLGIGALLFEEFGERAFIRRNAQAGVQLGTPEARDQLSLERASVVPGSSVMRANLVVNRVGKGLRCSGYNETRNILFIDPNQKEGHWLLPDNDHVIVENSGITDEKDPRLRRTVATAALVKPQSTQPEMVDGKLLLFDNKAGNVVEVANDARDLHVATLNNGELILLYERNRRLVLAAFEPNSLAKKREQEIQVPQFQ
jgi:hypothetical protein